MKKSKSHEMLLELRDHTDNDNDNDDDDDDHDDDPSATVPEELTYLEEMRLAKMVRSENNRRLLLTSTSYRRGNNRGNGNGNSRGNNRSGQGGSRHLLSSNSNDNDDYNEGNDNGNGNGNGNSEGGRDGGSSNDGAAKRRPSMLSSTRNIWHSMALCKEEDDDDDDDDDDDNAEKGGADGKANKDGDDADDDNNDDYALDYGYGDIESIPYNDVDDSQVPKQQQQQQQPCKETSSRRSSMKMIRRQSNVSNAWKSMAKFIADDDDNYDTAIDDTNNSNNRRQSMISNASAWKSMAKFIDDDNNYETEDNSDSDRGGAEHPHHQDGDSSSEGIPLYTRPVQRQLWGDPHLVVHIGWNTLFFDLFYVAAAYNLGNLLISVLNTTGGGDEQQQQLGRGLMYVIGIFGGIYNIFLRIMMYESQFSVPVDYSHRTVEVLRVFLLSIVVLHIKSLTGLRDPVHSIDAFAVTTSMFLETMVHVLLQLELYWVGEGDTLAIKNQTKRQLVTMLLPLSFFYFCGSILSGYLYYSNKHNQHNNTNNNHVDDEHYSAFDSDGYQRFLGGEEKEEASGGSSDYTDDYDGWTVGDIPIVLCFVATVYSLVVKATIALLTLHPQNSHIRSQMVPMNIDYFIHRFGEFTMLFFGEAVMGLLIVETTDSSTYYGVAILGVLTVVVLQAFKFESEPHGHDGGSDDHCLWRGMKCFFAYNLLTQVLCVGLIAFAVSFKVGLNYLVTTGSSSHTTSSSTSDDYNNNHNDDNHSSRMLGGGGSVSVSTDVIAILYCASLTLILTSIELMGYSHQGLIKTYALFFSENDESNNNNNEQQRQRRRSMVNWKVLFGTLFKLGLLVCVATLYLWIDQLDVLAGVGFLISIIFASSKVIEHLLVTKKHKVKKMVKSVSKRMSYNSKKSAEKKISAMSVTEKEFSTEDLNQTDTGIVFSDK